MACLVNKGYTLPCAEGIGGVKEIIIGNLTDFETGVTTDPTTEEVDALPTATIYRYVPFKNSGVYEQKPVKNLENGTLYYEQTVTWKFGKLSADKSKQFALLAKSTIVIFVRTADDQIIMVGRGSGANLTDGSAGSGHQKGDLMGYSVTFLAEEVNPAAHLEAYTTEPFDNFGGITVSPAYGSVS